jgi:uncharacterized repeat protein (TIGR01451 family)
MQNARNRYRLDRSRTTQFTDAWFVLALVLTTVGLLTHRPALVLISALLLTITPISWLWNYLSLKGIRYHRAFSEQRAFVGETVTLTTTVTNRKPLPVGWLQIDDELPEDLPLIDRELAPSHKPRVVTLTSIYSLRWYEQVEEQYELVCSHRGHYFLGATRMKAGDLFGLFENQDRIDSEDSLIVYPRVLSLDELGLPAKDPLGDVAFRRRILEDPVRTMGIRDYQPEDDLRRIHWKASARRQSLQVRVFEPTTAYNLIIFLNVANFERFWHGYDPVLLEKTITVAASVANFAAERRYAVGLMANGCLAEADQPIRVPPGRSPGQLTHILEMLSAITPIASMPLEDLLISESAGLPWGSTLVVVTGLVTEKIGLAVQRLRAAGRNMVLISLQESRPPYLEGVVIYHLPGMRGAEDETAEMAHGLSARVEDDFVPLEALERRRGAV